jgi:hypothetical protein
MRNVTLAPIKSTPTKTCLKVDKDEWELFKELMDAQGRSASDRVREMVRQTLGEYERANA